MTEFVLQLVGLVRPHLGPAAAKFVTTQLRAVVGDRDAMVQDVPLIAEAFHRKASGLISSTAADQLRASVLELAPAAQPRPAPRSTPPVPRPVEVPPVHAAQADEFGGVVQPDGRIGARVRLGSGRTG